MIEKYIPPGLAGLGVAVSPVLSSSSSPHHEGCPYSGVPFLTVVSSGEDTKDEYWSGKE